MSMKEKKTFMPSFQTLAFMVCLFLFVSVAPLQARATQELVWNFDRSAEVTQTRNFQYYRVANGEFTGTTKADPNIYLKLPPGGISVRDLSFLALRLYSSRSGGEIQIIYFSPNQDWCLGRSEAIKEGWQEYAIDLNRVAWNPRECSSPDAARWGGRTGIVSGFRIDSGDEADRKIKIDWVKLLPRVNPVNSASDLEDPLLRKYLLRPDSFRMTNENQYERKLILPAGAYTIWARVLEDVSARAVLDLVSFTGAVKTTTSIPGNSGRFKWVRTGTTDGGQISIRFARPPGIGLDALLICEGTDIPKEKAPVAEPVEKNEIVASPVRTDEVTAAPYWTGFMIAHPLDPQNRAVNTKSVSYYFRRNFTVPEEPDTAWLQISVDDYYRLYLNGEKIAENFTSNSWLNPAIIEVSARLKKGKNVVAVESINAGGAGGLLFDLTINRKNGEYLKIVSDSDFVGSDQLKSGWTAVVFDDGRWVKPIRLPLPPSSIWPVKIPYVDKRTPILQQCVSCEYRKTLTAGQSQVLKIRLKSAKPIRPEEVFYLRLENEGKTLFGKELRLTSDICRKVSDGLYEITQSLGPLSSYYPSMNLKLVFGIYGSRITLPEGLPDLSVSYKGIVASEILESAVQTTQWLPQLVVNGKVMYPVIMNREAPGEHRKGSRGANIATLWFGGIDKDANWWVGPGQYNFATVDKRIIQKIESDSSVLILPIFWVAPPDWWQAAHPAETSVFNDKTTWSYYMSTPSFSSMAWRRDAEEAVRNFVRHLETSPYGSKILGYWFIGGVSAEWQGWGCHTCDESGKLMDYSPAALRGFRDFLAVKYPGREVSTIEIPTLPERLAGEKGLFRDPVQAAVAIDYDQYYSESVAETILYFASVIKQAVNRKKIVGTYGGYSLEFTGMRWAYHMSGHNAFRKVFDSPDIDFLSAPPAYSILREIGNVGEWMWAFKSIQDAGKIVFVDDDTRTPLSGPGAEFCQAINQDQTTAVLRRNFGRTLCRRCPISLYPIVTGREFNAPATQRDICTLKKAGEYLNANNVRRKAEIAVVVDEDTVKYMSFDNKAHLTSDLVYYQRTRLGQIGASVDYLLFSDFKQRDHDYKLYIFLNCFQYDPATLAAVEKQIKARPVTALWCYAPGFIFNGAASLENMERLTGMKFGMIRPDASPVTALVDFDSPFTQGRFNNLAFGGNYTLDPLFYVNDPAARPLGVYQQTGQVSLAVKTVGQSQTIFCGSNLIAPDLLSNIARGAGVHLYSDTMDYVEANESFLMFHSAQAGHKTIRLKKMSDVVDVFERKVLFKNVDVFSFDISKGRTKVFFLGNGETFIKYIQQ